MLVNTLKSNKISKKHRANIKRQLKRLRKRDTAGRIEATTVKMEADLKTKLTKINDIKMDIAGARDQAVQLKKSKRFDSARV